jgi:hypothetical protein
MPKAHEVVEMIACMDEQERERFVAKLVHTWPHLADGIMTQIGFELMHLEAHEDYSLHA